MDEFALELADGVEVFRDAGFEVVDRGCGRSGRRWLSRPR